MLDMSSISDILYFGAACYQSLLAYLLDTFVNLRCTLCNFQKVMQGALLIETFIHRPSYVQSSMSDEILGGTG